MKHITKEQVTESHYIPANNVFAFFLTGGKDGATAEVIEESEKMEQRAVEDGMCSMCRVAFQQWYQRSCSIVIKQMTAGEKPTTDYAPFTSPCWAEKATT